MNSAHGLLEIASPVMTVEQHLYLIKLITFIAVAFAPEQLENQLLYCYGR